MISNIICRRSNKGVPHMLVDVEGTRFSVCWFRRKDTEGFYRIWNYDTQEKLLDVGLSPGGAFNLEFVLQGLIQKINELRNGTK